MLSHAARLPLKEEVISSDDLPDSQPPKGSDYQPPEHEKKTFPVGKVFLICSVFRPVGAEEGAQELHHEGEVGADKD